MRIDKLQGNRDNINTVSHMHFYLPYCKGFSAVCLSHIYKLVDIVAKQSSNFLLTPSTRSLRVDRVRATSFHAQLSLEDQPSTHPFSILWLLCLVISILSGGHTNRELCLHGFFSFFKRVARHSDHDRIIITTITTTTVTYAAVISRVHHSIILRTLRIHHIN